LHPSQQKTNLSFGGWGFTLLVGGKVISAAVSGPQPANNEGHQWFRGGVAMMDLETKCRGDQSCGNAVIVALRMPLLTHEELSQTHEVPVSMQQSAGGVQQ
jgi:hypothetical protein